MKRLSVAMPTQFGAQIAQDMECIQRTITEVWKLLGRPSRRGYEVVDAAADYLVEEAEFEWLGKGSGRVVLAKGDVAYKLARNSSIVRDNRWEWRTWVKADRQCRYRLLPLYEISSNGYILASARAEPLSHEAYTDFDSAQLERAFMQVQAATAGWGLPFGTEEVQYPNQWGLYQGRIVLLDYGEEPPPC